MPTATKPSPLRGRVASVGKAASSSTPGTWRVSDGVAVAFQDAKTAWAAAARDVLIETARRYHSYVTYGELSERIQERTGVRTRSQMRNWIGSVLGIVADECLRRSEPPLTALCVRQDETVGEGYAYVVQLSGRPILDDLDQHAAEARLECHRFFGAAMPVDGGRPALTPKVSARRSRTVQRKEKPFRICPQCFVALPSSGICDNCS